ncbi:MAG: hypothetical protein QXR97_05455 [Thermoproteota archaeon]
MTQGEEVASKVMQKIVEEGIGFIDLQFTDAPGRLQHITIPTIRFKSSYFIEGVLNSTVLLLEDS